MDKVVCIKRTIAKIAKCKVGITVLFPGDKQTISKAIKRAGNDNEITVNLDFVSVLMVSIYTSEYNVNSRNYLTLNEFRRTQFLVLMKKIIKYISTQELFYRDDENHLRLYSSKNGSINNQIGDCIIAFEPIVVVDYKQNVEYEGARFMINNRDTYADLTYLELLALYDVLNKADIFLYSQAIFNSMMLDLYKRTRAEEEDYSKVEEELDSLADLSCLKDRVSKLREEINSNGQEQTAESEQHSEVH